MNSKAVITFLEKQGYEVIDNYQEDGCDTVILVLGDTEVSVRTEKINIDDLSPEGQEHDYE